MVGLPECTHTKRPMLVTIQVAFQALSLLSGQPARWKRVTTATKIPNDKATAHASPSPGFLRPKMAPAKGMPGTRNKTPLIAKERRSGSSTSAHSGWNSTNGRLSIAADRKAAANTEIPLLVDSSSGYFSQSFGEVGGCSLGPSGAWRRRTTQYPRALAPTRTKRENVQSHEAIPKKMRKALVEIFERRASADRRPTS